MCTQKYFVEISLNSDRYMSSAYMNTENFLGVGATIGLPTKHHLNGISLGGQ